TSQGKQKGNSINIDDSQLPAEVNVKYYYPASFLKPKMLPVEGNNGVAWHHTDATTTTTTAAIPDLNMSETPITQAQFEYVFPDRAAVTTIGYNQPSYNYFSCSTNTNYAPSSAKPADMINWYDAIAYCNKLSAMEGKELCYAVSGVDDWLHLAYTSIPSETEENWDAATCNFTKNGYRLPTSSEWEYAARGGTANTSPVYSGSTYSDSGDDTEALDTVGWYNGNNIGNSGTVTYGTKAVKTKVANAFGLYDMSGNVCEWCWNWGNEEGGYPIATPTGDPVASTGSSARVRRGGSWSNSANLCRVSSRNISGIPYIRNNSDGFRVVCK
ncbi:MAG: formylglycine-generating enzyme family protein, partial [Dysgonamonadaceae bacterium]|nr:formylglycine-generating enzyme family protein [Dysgonamonadaceae bacterium]